MSGWFQFWNSLPFYYLQTGPRKRPSEPLQIWVLITFHDFDKTKQGWKSDKLQIS